MILIIGVLPNMIELAIIDTFLTTEKEKEDESAAEIILAMEMLKVMELPESAEIEMIV